MFTTPACTQNEQHSELNSKHILMNTLFVHQVALKLSPLSCCWPAIMSNSSGGLSSPPLMGSRNPWEHVPDKMVPYTGCCRWLSKAFHPMINHWLLQTSEACKVGDQQAFTPGPTCVMLQRASSLFLWTWTRHCHFWFASCVIGWAQGYNWGVCDAISSPSTLTLCNCSVKLGVLETHKAFPKWLFYCFTSFFFRTRDTIPFFLWGAQKLVHEELNCP